jgi:hypothetical protein
MRSAHKSYECCFNAIVERGGKGGSAALAPEPPVAGADFARCERPFRDDVSTQIGT